MKNEISVETKLILEKYKLTKKIQASTENLNKLKRHKIINRTRIAQTEKSIQAQEGERDVLTSAITQAQTVGAVVDKNNYTTYTGQVNAVYEMYNGRSDYGSEMCRGVIDTRVAFIAGAKQIARLKAYNDGPDRRNGGQEFNCTQQSNCKRIWNRPKIYKCFILCLVG
jgi:antitoxin component YwqK of YwqJK toxin-antitoxin module